MPEVVTKFSSVYGPVHSWRFGRSLGIDLIGSTPTCSYNCVYCQLGEIDKHTIQRQIYVPTEQVVQDLRATNPWEPIDVLTFSGHGEPTLALNLGECLQVTKQLLKRPTVVLTNSSLMTDPTVRRALTTADIVAAKLDTVSPRQLQSINRPLRGIDLPAILLGIKQFRQEYKGCLAIQTMVLSRWSPEFEAVYIQYLNNLRPDEVQLNVPSRPRVMACQQNSYGDPVLGNRPYWLRNLTCVGSDVLDTLATKIYDATQIPVRACSIRDRRQ